MFIGYVVPHGSYPSWSQKRLNVGLCFIFIPSEIFPRFFSFGPFSDLGKKKIISGITQREDWVSFTFWFAVSKPFTFSLLSRHLRLKIEQISRNPLKSSFVFASLELKWKMFSGMGLLFVFPFNCEKINHKLHSATFLTFDNLM